MEKTEQVAFIDFEKAGIVAITIEPKDKYHERYAMIHLHGGERVRIDDPVVIDQAAQYAIANRERYNPKLREGL